MRSKTAASITANLQLNPLVVTVTDGDFDASKLVVGYLQRDNAEYFEVLKSALAARRQCHLLLHTKMNTFSTHGEMIIILSIIILIIISLVNLPVSYSFITLPVKISSTLATFQYSVTDQISFL